MNTIVTARKRRRMRRFAHLVDLLHQRRDLRGISQTADAVDTAVRWNA